MFLLKFRILYVCVGSKTSVIFRYIYPLSCISLKIATWEAEACRRYIVCIIYLRTLRCIFVLILNLLKSCVFGIVVVIIIIIIIIIIICWHNSDQNNYRYSTENTKTMSKDKPQMQTHKYNNNKSHLVCFLK